MLRPLQALVAVGCVAAAVLLPGGHAHADTIALTPIATGLTSPVAIANAGDGSGWLFIVEQPGRIKIYDGTPPLDTFLDIDPNVFCCDEQGLLGLAFDPDYENNGFFYVNYIDNSQMSTIARYTVTANPKVADPNSEVIMKQVLRPRANHNGGQLAFGPDGFLYFGEGDSGSGGDPDEVAQDINSLLGKIWRLDVDAPPNYIAAGNPLIGQPGLDEIWAIGMRNPWRFSFDRLTGDLFIADVGQGSLEEIDFQSANTTTLKNYGWDTMEGSSCYEPSSGCNTAGLTLPIIEYGHGSGDCSVTGGYRYRGSSPMLAGLYIYGDFCTGRIWGATQSGATWTPGSLLTDAPFNISTFGEDEAGELYVADYYGGRVLSIALAADIDGDGDLNAADNCPVISNASQTDGDADALGDACESSYATNVANPDTDGDGCADGREPRVLTFTPQQGGDRDPASPWDFFDVPLPALTTSNPSGTKNEVVLLADALAVVYYAGTADNAGPNLNGVDYDTDLNVNGVEDGREYDRAPSSVAGKPWRSGAPNGAVTLADALVAVNQAGHNCTGAP